MRRFLVICSSILTVGSIVSPETAGTDTVWTAPPEARSRENPVEATSASIVRGARLYRFNCLICHGSSGRGDGPAAGSVDPRPTDLAVAGRARTMGDLAWKIMRGRGEMPGWEDELREEQIWDLVNFIKSLEKECS
ncbi:MAG: c-type cytochrome [Alphaproteobacteria bacterium]